jgi:hypothetical protein
MGAAVGQCRMVPVIIIGCLILAVIEHYTMDNTYGWMRAYGCAGCVRERGMIVSVWAHPGVPAFGGKYVTVWNSWDGHALSAAIIACFSRKREATTSGETPDSKCSMVPPIVKLHMACEGGKIWGCHVFLARVEEYLFDW